MAISGGVTVAYRVRVNKMFDGTLDWNHRNTRSTSADWSICDSPEVAVEKLKNGEQVLIAGSDIVNVERLIKKEQENEQ